MTLSDLITHLRSKTHRVRTGLWLYPPQASSIPDEAARLGLDAADLRATLLNDVPNGARWLGLDASRLIRTLDRLTETPGTSVLVVYNLDLPLARLTQRQRQEVWHDLLINLPHRRRALLLAMPDSANQLLPSSNDLDTWTSEGRLAR